jgi:hypothetical protein
LTAADLRDLQLMASSKQERTLPLAGWLLIKISSDMPIYFCDDGCPDFNSIGQKHGLGFDCLPSILGQSL